MLNFEFGRLLDLYPMDSSTLDVRLAICHTKFLFGMFVPQPILDKWSEASASIELEQLTTRVAGAHVALALDWRLNAR